MPTPKHLRQPPTRTFENYVFTREISPFAGLTQIADAAFTSVASVSNSGADDTQSLVPIGFDFVFDGVTYSKMVMDTNGWVALATSSATVAGAVQLEVMLSSSYQNEGANLNNLSSSILIAPWWDDLRNLYSSATAAVAGGVTGITSDQANRQKYGYEAPHPSYNQVAFGTKVYYDTNSRRGRRTIVRWRSFSEYSASTNVIAFELVLYESGMIEMRYAPRRSLTLSDVTATSGSITTFKEDATIGVFARGTNRFRDLSVNVGHPSASVRREYRYGGYVYDPSFNDGGHESASSFAFINRPYAWRLRPSANWPGLDQVGAIFRFAPPQNRRKVLPLKSLSVIDARPSYSSYSPGKSSLFDDRRAFSFVSGVVVNHPTTMPRFIGDSEQNVFNRQDLFLGSGNELEVTGGIGKNSVEGMIDNEAVDHFVARPFADDGRPEQASGSRDDAFFKSGSTNETMQPLWSKSQVKLALAVEYTTTLFDVTASILYYNAKSKAWTLPDNSTTATDSDVSLATYYANQTQITQDHRGFGPVGNMLSSASSPFDVINTRFTAASLPDALSRTWSESVTTNPRYEATSAETFELAITRPFVVEKAIIEVPFEFGSSWFADKTTNFLTITNTSGTYDFAGPGMTVALYNQVKGGSSSRRDLVMSGTITHVNDMVADVILSAMPPTTNEFQLRPVGFLSYVTNPGAVVHPSTNTQFTGSVSVKCEALSSNGIMVKFSKDAVAPGAAATNRDEMYRLLTQEFLPVLSSSGLYAHGFNYASVNAFGRAGQGLSLSGRSMIGAEFVDMQTHVVRNPLYLTGSRLSEVSSSLSAGTIFRATANISIEKHVRSPYLLLPGDKLVLALAKSRPCLHTAFISQPEFSGSTHDVKLVPGKINITLYGSQFSEDREVVFYDNTNASDSIHGVIE